MSICLYLSEKLNPMNIIAVLCYAFYLELITCFTMCLICISLLLQILQKCYKILSVQRHQINQIRWPRFFLFVLTTSCSVHSAAAINPSTFFHHQLMISEFPLFFSLIKKGFFYGSWWEIKNYLVCATNSVLHISKLNSACPTLPVVWW